MFDPKEYRKNWQIGRGKLRLVAYTWGEPQNSAMPLFSLNLYSWSAGVRGRIGSHCFIVNLFRVRGKKRG